MVLFVLACWSGVVGRRAMSSGTYAQALGGADMAGRVHSLAFRGSGHWAAWVSLVDTCRVNLFGGLLLHCVWTFHLPASGGACSDRRALVRDRVLGVVCLGFASGALCVLKFKFKG